MNIFEKLKNKLEVNDDDLELKDDKEIEILSTSKKNLSKNKKSRFPALEDYFSSIDEDLEETEEEKKIKHSISKYYAYSIANMKDNLKTDFIRAKERRYTYISFNERKITLIKENNKWYWKIEILSADISGCDKDTLWDGYTTKEDLEYLKCLVDATSGEYIYLGKTNYEIKELSTKEECILCDEMLTELIQDEGKYNKDIDSDFKVDNYYYRALNNEKNIILLGYFYKKKLIGYLCIKIIKDKETKKSYALFDALYVLKKYRRMYAATKLLRRGITIVKDKNIHTMKINVFYENSIALHLYKKVDFEEYKVELRMEEE